MKLKFDPNPSNRYPHGYWYASTDDAEYGEVGVTPIDAMSALVIAMELAVADDRQATNG